MSSPQRAVDDGESLLRSFRSRKSESMEASRTSMASTSYMTVRSAENDIEGDTGNMPNPDALSVGGLVAAAYSDRKGAKSGTQSGADDADSTLNPEQVAINLLSAALSKMDTGVPHDEGKGGGKPALGDLTGALVNLRDHLESTSVRRKVSFSPAAGRKSVGGDANGDSQAATGSNSTVDRSVLNNYMNNQLDLNETEMEFYEKTVDDLVGQLNAAQDEAETHKSELAGAEESLTTALGERDAALANAAGVLSTAAALEDELALTRNGQAATDEALQHMRAELASAKATAADWRFKATTAGATYDELNESTSKASAALEAALDATKEEVAELQRSLEMEITAKDRAQEEFDSLYREAEERAERAEDEATELRAVAAGLEGRVASETEAKAAVMALAEEAEKAAAAATTAATEATKAAAEARAEADAAIASTKVDRSESGADAGSGSSAGTGTGRGMIDTMMGNQLELQTAEMEQHEEEVNMLVEELEASKAELEKATTRAELALQERNALREEVKTLRAMGDAADQSYTEGEAGLQMQLRDAQEALDAERGAIADLEGRCTGLEDQVSELKELLGTAQEAAAEAAAGGGLAEQLEDANFTMREAEQRADRLMEELNEAWAEAEAHEKAAEEAAETVATLRNELTSAAERPAASTEHALSMLAEAQQELEKLRVDSSSSQAKLTAREDSLNTLHQELETMRAALDAAKAAQASAPSTPEVDSLQSQVRSLESSNADINGRLQHEVQVNQWLRGLMAKVGEKDETTEGLLVELRADREALAKQLQSTLTALETAKGDKARIAMELEDERRRAATRISDLERRRDTLETRNSAVSTSSEVDELREERRAVEEALAIERERGATLAATARESETTARKTESLMGQLGREVSHYYEVMARKEQTLLQTVEQWMEHYDQRVQLAATQVRAAMDSSHLLGARSSAADDDEDRAATLLCVTKAEARAEDAEQSLADLRSELELSRRERDDLERTVDEQKHRQFNETLTLGRTRLDDSQANISVDDFSRMSERLVEVERHAQEATQSGTKEAARGRRSLAAAEAELSQHRQLVDHLRLVNAKLMGDIRTTHLSIMQVKSLEHRLEVAHKQEQALTVRVGELELTIADREDEALDQQQQKLALEVEWTAKYEQDLAEQADDLRSSKHSAVAYRREADALAAELNDMKSTLSRGEEDLRRRMDDQAAKLTETHTRAERLATELTDSRGEVLSRDTTVQELRTQLDHMSQEQSAREEDTATTLERLNSEIQDKYDSEMELQAAAIALKKRVKELEKKANAHEEEATRLKDAHDTLRDDVGKMSEDEERVRTEVMKLTEELHLTRGSRDSHLTELEKLQNQFHEHEHVVHKHTQELLAKSERELMNVTERLHDATAEARDATDALKQSQSKATGTEARAAKSAQECTDAKAAVRAVERELAECKRSDASAGSRMQTAQDETQAKTVELDRVQEQLDSLREEHSLLIRQTEEYASAATGQTVSMEAIEQDGHKLLETVQEMVAEVGLASTRLSAETEAPLRAAGIDVEVLSSPMPVAPVVSGAVLDMDGGIETLGLLAGAIAQGRAAVRQLVQRQEVLNDSLLHFHGEHRVSVKRADNAQEDKRVVETERDSLKFRVQLLETEIKTLSKNTDAASSSVEAAERSLREHRRQINLVVADVHARASATLNKFSGPGSKHGALLRFGPTGQRNTSGDGGDAHDRVKHALLSMTEALEAAAAHAAEQEALVAAAEAKADKAERDGKGGHKSLQQRAEAAEKRVAASAQEITALTATGHTATEDLSKLKILLKEYTKTNAELEEEFKHAGATNGDLRAGLSEAEALVLELRTKLRGAEAEAEGAAEEARQARDDNSAAHRRLTRMEMEGERERSTAENIKADNEALHAIRRGLEEELEKAHSQLRDGVASSTTRAARDAGPRFELQKLMTAVDSTLAQTTGKAGVPASADAAVRVDDLVRRLAELRSDSRSKGHALRLAQQKVTAFEDEAVRLREDLSSMQTRIAEERAAAADEAAAGVRRKEALNDARQDDGARAAVERLQEEAVVLRAACETERAAHKRSAAEAMAKATESQRLAAELLQRGVEMKRLRDGLEAAKARHEETSAEHEAEQEQLRTARATVAKLTVGVERLEKAVQRSEADRSTLAEKLRSAELKAASRGHTRARKDAEADLRVQLTKAVETQRQHHEAKLKAVADLKAARNEGESREKQLAALSTRLAAVVSERVSADAAASDMRDELERVRSSLEQEQELRLSAEESVLRVEEQLTARSVVTTTEVTSLRTQAGKVTELQAQARTLGARLEKVMKVAEESERRANIAEQSSRTSRQEAISGRAQLAQSRASEQQATAQASRLRAEGRRVRGSVTEIVSVVRSLWGRIAASETGGDMHSKPDRGGGGSSSSNTGAGGDDKDDIFGLKALASANAQATEALRVLRTSPKTRLELEASLRRAEGERLRMVKELQGNEAVQAEALDRVMAEKRDLQAALDATTKGAGGQGPAGAQHAVLTAERSARDNAEHESSRLRRRLEEAEWRLANAAAAAAAAEASSGSGPSADVQGAAKAAAHAAELSHEVASIKLELKSARHHRDTLKGSVKELDRRFSEQADALAEARRALGEHTGAGTGASANKSTEALRKELTRVAARAQSAEALAGVYRTAMVSGSNQVDIGIGAGAGLLLPDHELEIVKRSYAEEVSKLEGELEDTHTSLAVSKRSMADLQTRYEAYALSGGKDVRGPGKEAALAEAERSVIRAETALAGERKDGRRRHAWLVDDLLRTLEARDHALAAVRRLEDLCIEAGMRQAAKEMTVAEGTDMGPDYETVTSGMAGTAADRRQVIEAMMEAGGPKALPTQHVLASEPTAQSEPTQEPMPEPIPEPEPESAAVGTAENAATNKDRKTGSSGTQTISLAASGSSGASGFLRSVGASDDAKDKKSRRRGGRPKSALNSTDV